MAKVIQIEVPDWVDEQLKEAISKVIREKVDEIIVEAAWDLVLEKSTVTDEDVMKLDEAIKRSAWKKLERELKDKGILNE